jgi:hypothetical protein
MERQIGLAPANDPRPVGVKFLTRPLERDQIAQAYALIQSTDPAMTLDRWARFAHKLIAPQRSNRHGGIMTVQTEAGYMCGLFAFEIVDDLRLNRTLAIRNVFAISLVQPEAIIRALLEAAESLANLNGCAAITAIVDKDHEGPGNGWVAGQLASNGFSRAGIFSAKPLGALPGGHPVLGKKT